MQDQEHGTRSGRAPGSQCRRGEQHNKDDPNDRDADEALFPIDRQPAAVDRKLVERLVGQALSEQLLG